MLFTFLGIVGEVGARVYIFIIGNMFIHFYDFPIAEGYCSSIQGLGGIRGILLWLVCEIGFFGS